MSGEQKQLNITDTYQLFHTPPQYKLFENANK